MFSWILCPGGTPCTAGQPLVLAALPLVADVIAINNAVFIDRCSREEDGIDLKGDH